MNDSATMSYVSVSMGEKEAGSRLVFTYIMALGRVFGMWGGGVGVTSLHWGCVGIWTD